MRSKIDEYISHHYSSGKTHFILRGGRRSGKTFAILRFLMLYCEAVPKTVVNVASMTAEQGRLGAYADAKTIRDLAPTLFEDVEVLTSPREFRFANGSRIHFNQYSNSETAKGIACDWLFINEANNFTKQQYVDLAANVRRGIFLDYNPNIQFWVDDLFTDDDICDSTWRDNPYLTPTQLEYFAMLKRQAERPDATAVDRRNYSVYYLGRYSELQGSIFNEDVIKFGRREVAGLHHFAVFCDPSALRGNDYFACCLTAVDDYGVVWLVDSYSVNTGSRAEVAKKIRQWCAEYDVTQVYVETNGIIGQDFYDYCFNSGLNVAGWYSHQGKFERIIANYQNLREKMRIMDTEQNRAFMQQVWDFAEKMPDGLHDDNIDALNSSYTMQSTTAA